MEHIASAAEIADKLDVTRSMVYAWTDPKNRRFIDDFPKPITVVGEKVRLWDMRDINRWGKETGRLDPSGQPVRRSAD